MNSWKWVVLSVIIGSAFFLRVWKLSSVPGGFFCDEAALGYNAWAISRYGIDEMGMKFPLYARSLGVQKNPVFVYSSMIPIRLFGLSEWSVRLTSAVYGTLTAAGLFWLVYLVHGFTGGALAAFFLTILPWNFHFSRIAFELITWPCLFVWGLALLIYAVKRGGWPWLAAALVLGLSLHSYVMAMSFLPLFLLIFALVYLKKWIIHWPWVLAALILFSLPASSAVHHHIHTARGDHYTHIGWWPQTRDQPLHSRLNRFIDSYKPFFSKDFLVIHGDPNPRHSIRHHGPVYQSLFYLSIAGIILGLYPPSRYYLLLISWTILYPLGTALTIDRYTSRSIIGSPLAPLWTSFALIQLCRLFSRLPIRSIVMILQGSFLGTVILYASDEAFIYFKRYFSSYNLESASGIYGFQFGYRDVIRFMESRRNAFDQLILTAHNVNEPYIFSLFYNRIDPRHYVKTGDYGYKILRSYAFNRYPDDIPTLIALHPDELIFFDKYSIHHRVMGYDKSVVFYIIEPLVRRPSLYYWSMRGLWRHLHDGTCDTSYFNPPADFMEPVDTLTGPVFWTPTTPNPPIVDIQAHFRESDPKHPGNPEQVIAEGVCWTYFDNPESGYVEILGSKDYFSLWLNHNLIFESCTLHAEKPLRKSISIQTGWNEWAFRSCEDVGDWYFMLTLRQITGEPLEPRQIRIAPPGTLVYPGNGSYSGPLQFSTSKDY